MTGVQPVRGEGRESMTRTFDVKGTWESDTVASPPSAVGGKVVGLNGTGGLIRKSKVVTATNETGFGCTGVLGGKVRVLVA